MELGADIKQYLDNYGYQIVEEEDKLVFRNSKYARIMPNVLLSILGLVLTIIGIASAYKILLFFILMIFIPLLKLINNYPKEVIIDSNKRKIFDIDFAKVEDIRLEVEVQNTYATPFRKGTKKYYSKIIMKTKAGNEYALIGLVDMNEDKGEIPGLLLEYLRAEVIQ